MAERLLYGTVDRIIESLCSLAFSEIGLFWGVKDELLRLGDTVSTIRAVLLDAEEQQAESHAVRNWLEKLDDAIYDADDLLGAISTETLRRKIMTRDKKAKKVRIFFSESNQLAFRLKMVRKIKNIRKRLDAIQANGQRFNLHVRRDVRTLVLNGERDNTHSLVRVETVLGREDDKKAIIDLLMNSNVEENVSILPIVGIGGLGKTTLAQFVFNDHQIQEHFELKMWVCVSDIFDVKIIVAQILESATKVKPTAVEMDTLVNILLKEIEGKKYFLVLDDVWNGDHGKWCRLKQVLMGGARGSRIVVTTRNEIVARTIRQESVAGIIGTVESYPLEGLDEDASWSLFKQKAFGREQEPENLSITALGKEIVKKCKGVPLAISTIGSLLGSKNSEAEWVYFKNNELSEICQNLSQYGRQVEPRVGNRERDNTHSFEVGNRERDSTHSFVPAEVVIGRRNDKKAVIDLLIDSNVEENVSILPIVGIGGLGKTTLAQFVFNDEQIQEYFELKMWVCVSDIFDVKDIVAKVVESATKEKPADAEMDTLVARFRENIGGKKYFLVLDDVWNDNHGKWRRLKEVLMGGARGSRIVVTTRNEIVAKTIRQESVASIIGTVESYSLKGLDEDAAWSLFKQKAFERGQEPKNSSMAALGKEIVKKCSGVPSTITTIGSLLGSKSSEAEWVSFKNNELSEICQNLSQHGRQVEPGVGNRERDNTHSFEVRNRERNSTHSFVPAEVVIGRRNDKKAVIDLLMDSNVEENVSILPIVGIGGLGKTTLAQFVFNDEQIQEHFELKMWVCVSDIFDVKDIVAKVVESATKEKPAYAEMDTLVARLRENIGGKKYFLVLDDVWNDDHGKWRRLKEVLMGGARGSRIVVTTRNEIVAKTIRQESVASIIGTVESYSLKGLDEDAAWSLFKQKAFERGQEPENSSMVALGKEVVKKCSGVPLAITTIGSLLGSKNSEAEWVSFKNNELSKIFQLESDILLTLKLSCDHLPPHLNHCFAYCSLFPKNYMIDKSTLIKLWIAQGFVKLSDQNRCLEEVGDEYFMDLLQRSFFREAETDEFGNIIGCRLHDLMHDLAMSMVGSLITTIYGNYECIGEKTRHVSFGCYTNISYTVSTLLNKASRVRTFLQLDGDHIGVDYDTIFSSFKSLHVLVMHKSDVDFVPSSIGKLKYLTYLDLSRNYNINKLPDSITMLQNLQTLRLSKCESLKELPRDIINLANLRHLEIDECYRLAYMPRGLGQLTNLQSLSRFVVNSSHSDSGGLDELSRLNNLSGKLVIENLEHNVKGVVVEYEAANLKEKHRLDALHLWWSSQGDVIDSGTANDEAEGLRPHTNLKYLCLGKYRGSRLPYWFLSLKNLFRFELYWCKECQYLPPLSQLPSLRYLLLVGLDAMEYISDGGASDEKIPFLPFLKEISLSGCHNLKGWWKKDSSMEGNRDSHNSVEITEDCFLPSFPPLSTLSISFCPKLTSMPMFPHLEEKLILSNASSKPLQQTMMMNMAALQSPTTIATTSSSSIPLSKLKYLELNSIEDLEALPEEWLQNLTSLQSLKIGSCSILQSLPSGLQHAATLQKLEISSIADLETLPEDWLKNLTSLKSLKIGSCSRLQSLPSGLQHAATLQKLEISNCVSLTAIPEWIHNCISLKVLEIRGCSSLASLPEGMRRLTSLQRLTIVDCPKVAHIPELDLR